MSSEPPLNLPHLPELRDLPADRQRDLLRRAMRESMSWDWQWGLLVVAIPALLLGCTFAAHALNDSRFNPGLPYFAWYLLAVVGAIAATGLLVRELQRRLVRPHLRRMLPHLCPSCGYDLRASESRRCPECGSDEAC